MKKRQFCRDKKAVKRSVSDTCSALLLALQITGYSQTADQDRAVQKAEQVQGIEKEGTGAERSSAETEKSGSGIGEAGREQSVGSSQADAKVAAGQGDSMIESKPGMSIKEGVATPDFIREFMDGTSTTLSELQGKSVIINFWTTWCGSCVKEMPVFEHLKDDSGDEIGIIVVNYGDDVETVKDFAEENGYTFPVALDEEYPISILYPINSIPYTVVLDAEGKVTHISTGALDADTMYERYKEVLGVQDLKC